VVLEYHQSTRNQVLARVSASTICLTEPSDHLVSGAGHTPSSSTPMAKALSTLRAD
jgi:hypothetical protein